MAALLAEHKLTVVICVTLAIAFLWLDVALYFRVQSLHSVYPITTTNAVNDHVQVNTSNNKSISSVSSSSHRDLSISPSKPIINSQSSSSSQHAISSSANHNHPREHIFSPFKGLSVKMVMMDQVNNYLFSPMGEIFNEMTDFSSTFTFISPNMVSFAGVIVAVISGKLVTSDSFLVRRIAVLVFQVRTFLDALDGIVARDRAHITQHISQTGTMGYFVDGVCDAIGFAAFMIGLLIYLRKTVPRHYKYIPLDVHLHPYHTSAPNSSPTSRYVFFVCACYGFQLFASAAFWNLYLDRYHSLLETPAETLSQANLQTEVMRSSITWSLMWFWRVFNSHALMQYLLVAVFVNRTWEFLLWAQWPGMTAIATLVFFCEIHVRDVSAYIDRAKFTSL